MTDIILKLFILPFSLRLNRYFISDFRRWKKEYWHRNLGDYFCCSGLDGYGQGACGCYGATVKSEMLWANLPGWMARRLDT